MDPQQPPASEPGDQPVSNLFAPILGLVAIGLLACTVWALGLSDSQVADGVSRCGAIANERARLACYDKLAEPHPPARGAFGVLPSPHEGSQ